MKARIQGERPCYEHTAPVGSKPTVSSAARFLPRVLVTGQGKCQGYPWDITILGNRGNKSVFMLSKLESNSKQ